MKRSNPARSTPTEPRATAGIDYETGEMVGTRSRTDFAGSQARKAERGIGGDRRRGTAEMQSGWAARGRVAGQNETIDFTIELGAWGGHYKRLPGASWRALLVDAATGERYAGSDDDPWAAIAWALHERELRRSGVHTIARGEHDRPEQSR